jgi:hypothetical protein
MKITQLSLFLENKPGALELPVKALAKAKLNILTLSLADTQQFGILRLILKDWEKAKKLLERHGFVVKVTEMLALEVADKPGRLSEILAIAKRAGVNIEYMYGFTLAKGGKGLLAFRFDDPDGAVEALQKKGINPVQSVDLFKLVG